VSSYKNGGVISVDESVDAIPVLPIYLLCDTSKSMVLIVEKNKKRIDVLNEAIVDLFTKMLNLNRSTIKVKVCVISFNTLPYLVSPLNDITSGLPLMPLEAKGSTFLAKALNFLDDRLDIDENNRNRTLAFRPVAFIISDGEPLDSELAWKSSCERLASRELPPRIVLYLVADPCDKLIDTLTMSYDKELLSVNEEIFNNGEDVARAIRSAFNDILFACNAFCMENDSTSLSEQESTSCDNFYENFLNDPINQPTITLEGYGEIKQ
jgi:von willebrand factor type A domain